MSVKFIEALSLLASASKQLAAVLRRLGATPERIPACPAKEEMDFFSCVWTSLHTSIALVKARVG